MKPVGKGGADVKKRARVTAEAARRITGISLPFGGVQWADPGPTERERIRRFILVLEDRRALYNPMLLETRSEVEHSLHAIRQECTETLRSLGEKAFGVLPVRSIREACRRFHDDARLDFRLYHGGGRHHGHDEEAGFFAALGAFRATVGYQIALLAGHYDIDVEGDLAEALPALPEGTP